MKHSGNHNYERIRWVLLFTLALNWAIAIVKMVIGYFTRCQSMIADGLHSLSDGTSNIIGLIGMAVSSRPVDKDHPYGHKKYETFFTLGIAALLLLISLSLIRQSFFRISHPIVPQAGLYSFIIMIATIAVNVFVMNYEHKQGVKLRSDILIADSLHTKADVYTSISVIIALVGIKLGFPIIDPIATFVIAMFIGHAALDIIKDASKILCDSVAIVDSGKISGIVTSIKGVKACHKIRTRGRPDDICIDLHVQVDSGMTVEEAHNVSYAVESSIKKIIPEVTDVLVHMEPDHNRKALKSAKDLARKKS